ncbi:MAG TPA: response regulator [Streptosporangiaceae bacterium]
MPVSCLIVDDSDAFLRAARELLQRGGINVVGTASTAAQACHRCRELSPDVALIDIDLGTDSGIDLARELAACPDTSAPRVILISAYSGEDFADLIADSPAISFLPKADLSAAKVRGILARAGASPG